MTQPPGPDGQAPEGPNPCGSAPPPPAPAPAYGAAPPAYANQAPAAYGAPQAGYGQPPAGAGAVPGMGMRLLARIIDGVLVGIVLGVFGAILIRGAASQVEVDPQTGAVTGGGGSFLGALFLYILLATVITLAYEVVMIALRGATIGKQLLKIKVVRESDGGVPGWGPSLLRWVVPQGATLVTFFLGGLGGLVVYLSPLFDNSGRQQGWHDKIAKTQVVTSR